jgi:hypothetical protein
MAATSRRPKGLAEDEAAATMPIRGTSSMPVEAEVGGRRRGRSRPAVTRTRKNGTQCSARRFRIGWQCAYADAAFGARLRELRWKNSAWLATADTIAGWNGFEIRNAGSGRSPVRKRSG